MAIRKRQLVLAALVVALGAAVYLNWQFGGNSQIVDAGTSVSDKELGAAQLVNGSVDSSPSSAVSEAVSSAVSRKRCIRGFFRSGQYRSEYRCKYIFCTGQIGTSEIQRRFSGTGAKVLDDTTADENTKTEAANQAAEISQNIVTETNIENLVKSKGFVDCVAFIQNGACNVVVQKTVNLRQPMQLPLKILWLHRRKYLLTKLPLFQNKRFVHLNLGLFF